MPVKQVLSSPANGIRGYTNKVRLPFGKGFAQRGLREEQDCLCNIEFTGDWTEFVGELMGTPAASINLARNQRIVQKKPA